MKQHAQELLPVPYSVKLLETFILITWFSFDKKKTYQKILVGPRPQYHAIPSKYHEALRDNLSGVNWLF